jgi:hypothetical protein
MAEITVSRKQTRVRCSDQKFLEAVYSSKTYADIAEKTGQKIASTMARYARVKKVLAEAGVTIPEMTRKKPVRTVDNIEEMVAIAKRLKERHCSK